MWPVQSSIRYGGSVVRFLQCHGKNLFLTATKDLCEFLQNIFFFFATCVKIENRPGFNETLLGDLEISDTVRNYGEILPRAS